MVIDCSHIHQTDFTAAKGFEAMLSDFQARSQPVFWLNPSAEVTHVLKFIAGDAFTTIERLEDIVPNNAVSYSTEPLLEAAVVADYKSTEQV